jgi:hypothetical protein
MKSIFDMSKLNLPKDFNVKQNANNAIRSEYEESLLQKPEVTEVPNLNTVIEMGKKGAEKGGFLGGLGGGIGGLIQYLNTAEGKQILAGVTNNPAYLDQAKVQQGQESQLKQAYKQSEAERQKRIADYELKKMDIEAEEPAKALNLRIQERELADKEHAIPEDVKFVTANKFKEEEVAREIAEKQAKAEADALKAEEDAYQRKQQGRSTFKKVLGIDAPRDVKAPAIGTIKNGYKYIGGDPSKKESWSK